jgi:hypothetical protein
MPALPSASFIFKITLSWDVGTDTSAVTILHWLYAGLPPTPAQCSTWCTSFNALTSAEWPLVMGSSTTYLGVSIIDLTSPTSAEGSAGTSVVGTRSGATLGAGTALLAHYPIGRRYRGGKPRSYLPWGTADDLNTRNTWITPFLTIATTTWQAILNAVPAAGPVGTAALVSQVNLSYYGPPNRTITGSTGRVRTVSTVRPTPLIDLISGFSMSGKLASQRRRNLQRS